MGGLELDVPERGVCSLSPAAGFRPCAGARPDDDLTRRFGGGVATVAALLVDDGPTRCALAVVRVGPSGPGGRLPAENVASHSAKLADSFRRAVPAGTRVSVSETEELWIRGEQILRTAVDLDPSPGDVQAHQVHYMVVGVEGAHAYSLVFGSRAADAGATDAFAAKIVSSTRTAASSSSWSSRSYLPWVALGLLLIVAARVWQVRRARRP
jgi:hypothetical protein